MNRQTYRPIEPSGKAIQDRPTLVDLAQDLCCSRAWVSADGFNVILTADEKFVAENFENLAARMKSAGAFFETSGGAWQITQEFHSLSDDALLAKLAR